MCPSLPLSNIPQFIHSLVEVHSRLLNVPSTWTVSPSLLEGVSTIHRHFIIVDWVWDLATGPALFIVFCFETVLTELLHLSTLLPKPLESLGSQGWPLPWPPWLSLVVLGSSGAVAAVTCSPRTGECAASIWGLALAAGQHVSSSGEQRQGSFLMARLQPARCLPEALLQATWLTGHSAPRGCQSLPAGAQATPSFGLAHGYC
ncbi:hypothetical protein H1C71_007663 [Ictidomys tridecemlineatus]|nr:hypothetical protein H1C71_007663 [Ictidomys tridecemlineatus]